MSNNFRPEKGYYSVLSKTDIIEGMSGPSSDSKVKAPSPAALKPLNMMTPNSIYDLESSLMQQVDIFQQKYSRFLRCDDAEYSNLVNPKCHPVDDGLNSLNSSYKNVMFSAGKLKAALDNIRPTPNTELGDSNDDYIQSREDLNNTYEEIKQLRNQLDNRLAVLYNEQEGGKGSSIMNLDSTMYTNTLWTILATCLLYYVLVEL
jgi:hypothetical protein